MAVLLSSSGSQRFGTKSRNPASQLDCDNLNLATSAMQSRSAKASRSYEFTLEPGTGSIARATANIGSFFSAAETRIVSQRI